MSASNELKQAVEDFDRGIPQKEKEMRKVKSGFLDHPRISRLIKESIKEDRNKR